MSPLRILAIVLCGVSALALALCLFTSGNDGLLLPQRRGRQCDRPLCGKEKSKGRIP